GMARNEVEQYPCPQTGQGNNLVADPAKAESDQHGSDQYKYANLRCSHRDPRPGCRQPHAERRRKSPAPASLYCTDRPVAVQPVARSLHVGPVPCPLRSHARLTCKTPAIMSRRLERGKARSFSQLHQVSFSTPRMRAVSSTD